MILEEQELMNINGGGFKLLALLGGIGVFIAGVIDGFVRPLKCN